MMQAKQQEDIVKRRVSTTVVRNELRLRKWGLGRERGRRLPAHPASAGKRDPLTGWSRENAALSGAGLAFPLAWTASHG